jgi:hypothetical protein
MTEYEVIVPAYLISIEKDVREISVTCPCT